MKYAATILLACIAVAAASYHFDIPENRLREKKVNTINAQRQSNVNYYAEKIGASSGTYRRDGVPGTPLGVTGKGYYPGQGYNNHHAGYPGYQAGYPGYHGGYNGYPAGYAGHGHGAYPGAYAGAHY